MAKNNNEKYELLKKALLKAITFSEHARQEHIAKCERSGRMVDGGTCNFDSPTLDYRAMGMSKKKAVETIEQAGLRCFEWRGYYGSILGLVICGMTAGQGNLRTEMAEAFNKSLKADGIASDMYYQCD